MADFNERSVAKTAKHPYIRVGLLWLWRGQRHVSLLHFAYITDNNNNGKISTIHSQITLSLSFKVAW